MSEQKQPRYTSYVPEPAENEPLPWEYRGAIYDTSTRPWKEVTDTYHAHSDYARAVSEAKEIADKFNQQESQKSNETR